MKTFRPIDPEYKATKSATQLLAEGVPHAGGLAQIAAAEQMENPPPALAAVRAGYLQIMEWQEAEKKKVK